MRPFFSHCYQIKAATDFNKHDLNHIVFYSLEKWSYARMQGKTSIVEGIVYWVIVKIFYSLLIVSVWILVLWSIYRYINCRSEFPRDVDICFLLATVSNQFLQFHSFGLIVSGPTKKEFRKRNIEIEPVCECMCQNRAAVSLATTIGRAGTCNSRIKLDLFWQFRTSKCHVQLNCSQRQMMQLRLISLNLFFINFIGHNFYLILNRMLSIIEFIAYTAIEHHIDLLFRFTFEITPIEHNIQDE